jgi:hypothetical protein
MQLEFKINGQTLRRVDQDIVIEHSRGFLKAHFDMPSDYTGTVSAFFQRMQNGVLVGTPVELDANNICSVPDDVIIKGKLYVSISSSPTAQYIPTNKVEITIYESGVPIESIPLPSGIVNEYADFQRMYSEISDTADRVQEIPEIKSQLAATGNRIDTIVTGLDNYYVKCLSTDTGALLVVASGATAGQINLSAVSPRMSTYTPVAGDYVTKASNILNAELVLARNSAVKSKVFGTLDARLEEAEADVLANATNIANKVDLAIVDSKTGTSVQSTVADDLVGGVELTKIEGAVTVTKPNEAADISPDNVASITFPSNFDVVASGSNMFDGQLEQGSTNGAIGQPMSNVSVDLTRVRSTNILNISKLITHTIAVNAGYQICLVLSNGTLIEEFKTWASSITFSGYSKVRAVIRRTDGANISPSEVLVQLNIGGTALPYTAYKGSNKTTVTHELRKLPNGVADTIELGTDGKWRYIKRIEKFILNGSEDCKIEGDIINGTIMFNTLQFLTNASNRDRNASMITNRLKLASSDIYTLGAEAMGYTKSSNYLRVRIGTSRLATQDIGGIKSWLASNPVTIYYELATPIETILPDQILISYKGITNVYTTANPQVGLTVNFKSKLKNVFDVLNSNKANVKQEDWITPTLINGWTTYGTPWLARAGYYKDSTGVVHLTGSLKPGAATILFTLPSGYRPLSRLDFICATDAANNNMRINVASAGTITVLAFTGYTWISLDGISFKAEQ